MLTNCISVLLMIDDAFVIIF